ncbi:hypothetical protein NP233_g3516 [Leucocoprinus birnbaumii]|uniref:Alpha/beta-hydrolase n=1 Tax=Leucocoprinus birnbaumii TaxID=56174 RepID=A0AAD5YXX3_9AGAR|nr:hypothetical protein NP233_g3516 [Leucocoprinus birnbaumii]
MPNSDITLLTATLSNDKAIAYYDSGPVIGSTSFTTLVLLHGFHFNSRGFIHLFPLASQFNLRLILAVRRDYEGSTRYTDAEISTLGSESPFNFFAEAGGLLAEFLYYLVKNTKVCEATKDRLAGGIAVAGWSLGSVFAQTMFYERTPIDEKTYTLIEPYVLSLILIDPPHCALGIPIPPEYGHLFFPPDIIKDSEELKQSFRRWVTCYYDHDTGLDGARLSKLDSREVTENCIFET